LIRFLEYCPLLSHFSLAAIATISLFYVYTNTKSYKLIDLIMLLTLIFHAGQDRQILCVNIK
jgi:hypothetical protein